MASKYRPIRLAPGKIAFRCFLPCYQKEATLKKQTQAAALRFTSGEGN